MTLIPTFCRVCYHLCGAVVEVDERGRAVSMTGDRENPLYQGYGCMKGRASPSMHNSPDRLLNSMKRQPDGTFIPISVEQAMDEIAIKLSEILDKNPPRSVAAYCGTGSTSGFMSMNSAQGFLRSIDSPMSFGSISIDQPGKVIAKGLHGVWQAPSTGWTDPQAILAIGANPLVSHTGFPYGNPNTWVNDQLRKGMQLIVIDPRKSETARKATLFLQPLPGHDAAILAAMNRVIIDEGLYDAEFVRENVTGLEDFRAALDRFSPRSVAAGAGIDAEQLIEAARIYASARRAYAICGTGPSMAGSSTLVEYLRMCLETLCGHYCREGDSLPMAPVVLAQSRPKAQATPPFPAWGDELNGPKMRVRGLSSMHAVSSPMPTTALPDEILVPGEGQVKALFTCAGNPVLAWPDQNRTIEALRQIDLHVVLDVKMTPTAQLADYVIACKMHLETPAVTAQAEGFAFYSTGIGTNRSYGQYTPAIVEPPAGSEVIEDWEFFYGLCRRMGLPLAIISMDGKPFELNMAKKPSTDEMLAGQLRGSCVPLEELKKHPHGVFFPEDNQTVGPKDAGWEGRLDLANADMLADLATLDLRGSSANIDAQHPFLLISRRLRHTYNSIAHDPATRGQAHNSAYMHPEDVRALGLADGDVVEIRSRYGAIYGVIESDETVRRGLVSMAHGYGAGPDRDLELFRIGSSTTRLTSVEDDPECYSGQPRMSGIAVSIRASNFSSPLDQPEWRAAVVS